MKRRLAALSACALVVSLSGCGGSAAPARSTYVDNVPPPEEPLVMSAGQAGTYGGRFVIPIVSAPQTFNPLTLTTTYSADVAERLFATLTNFPLDVQQNVPSLATRWECDAVSCTFHLRRGAAFSDGHPLTSEDVAFSFAAINDPRVDVYGRDFWHMNGVPLEVVTPDPLTVTVIAPQPNANLLTIASGAAILPKHVLQSALAAGAMNAAYNVNTPVDEIVTSGPWRVKMYVPNERVVLARNPYWFGTDATGQRLPYLDELVFSIVPDAEAADLKFQSGELDALTRPAPATVQWYVDRQNGADFTVHTLGPALGTSMMFFNQDAGKDGKEPPVGRMKASWFTNATFRRAVSAAIDRDSIIASVFAGYGVKYWSLATPADKRWFLPDTPHDDYDPDRARQMLASLGWRDRDGNGVLEDTQGHSVAFTLTVTAGPATPVATANFIRDDLMKVGLRVTLNPLEFNALSASLDRRQYDALLMGFSRGSLDPPGRFFHSQGTHPFQKQFAGEMSAAQQRVDDLFASLLSDPDETRRKAWLHELNTIVNEQAWVTWLPVQVMRTPIRNRFGNVRPSSASSSASSVVWNAEQFFVKPRARETD